MYETLRPLRRWEWCLAVQDGTELTYLRALAFTLVFTLAYAHSRAARLDRSFIQEWPQKMDQELVCLGPRDLNVAALAAPSGAAIAYKSSTVAPQRFRRHVDAVVADQMGGFLCGVRGAQGFRKGWILMNQLL